MRSSGRWIIGKTRKQKKNFLSSKYLICLLICFSSSPASSAPLYASLLPRSVASPCLPLILIYPTKGEDTQFFVTTAKEWYQGYYMSTKQGDTRNRGQMSERWVRQEEHAFCTKLKVNWAFRTVVKSSFPPRDSCFQW